MRVREGVSVNDSAVDPAETCLGGQGKSDIEEGTMERPLARRNYLTLGRSKYPGIPPASGAIVILSGYKVLL